MNTESSKKEKYINPLIPAILLAVYAVWEILAMLLDFADISDLCLSPASVICIALISILLFTKKRGLILVIPFALLAVIYILNIYSDAVGTYYAYFPLSGNSYFENMMRFEYFCNIFVIVIDFALSASIILLLISNKRSKGNKNIFKYALLVLVIVRLLIFLLFYLPTSSLLYMPTDYATYYFLTPFLFYIGLLLCGFYIADLHKNKVVEEEVSL